MPVEIFISYAHKDKLYLDELMIHLKPLQEDGLIQTWSDAAIRPGMERQEAIGTHLNTAQVILLLISPDFLASDYCYGTEMERAVGRHRRGARVIPVILRTTDNWKNAPFGKLQALPKEAKPIKLWRDKDQAYASVANGIRQAIGELTTQLPPAPSPDRPTKAPEEAPPVPRRDIAVEKLRTQPFSELLTPKQTQGSFEKSIAEKPQTPRKKWRKHSAVVPVASLVGVLAIVLVSMLLNTISQSRNHSQPTATLTRPTITIPPQSTSSVNVPVFGFDTQHTHFNPSEHILSASTITSLKLFWTASIGAGIAETFFPSSPAVANRIVYVGSWDSKLYALDISKGKTLWSAQTGGHITSSPAVVNGIVYVGSWDKKLYAFDASTGKTLWVSAPTGNSISSSPVVDNGIIYVGSQDGKLYAYKVSSDCAGNKSSCDPLWSVQMGISITSSSPTVDHGVIYVGSWDHKLYALDVVTHAIMWKYLTGDIVWSSPAVANDLVYIGSQDGKLYALDAKTGGFKWEYRTGKAIHSSPTVVNEVVYIGSDDGELYALKASTGELLWKSAYVDAAFFSSPMIANGLVYLSSNNRTLYVYKASECGNSCYPLWTSSSLSGPILSSPTVVDGAVYLGSQDGHLYAFHLSDATP